MCGTFVKVKQILSMNNFYEKGFLEKGGELPFYYNIFGNNTIVLSVF